MSRGKTAWSSFNTFSHVMLRAGLVLLLLVAVVRADSPAFAPVDDCNVCKCGQGKDTDGKNRVPCFKGFDPTPEGAMPCLLSRGMLTTSWVDLPPRKSDDGHLSHMSRVLPDFKTAAMAKVEKDAVFRRREERARERIEFYVAETSDQESEAPKPNLQWVPSKPGQPSWVDDGVHSTEILTTCKQYSSVMKIGIADDGFISSGQILTVAEQNSVYAARVWSSDRKNALGGWWDPYCPVGMSKVEYAIKNVICAEWNPQMDRCAVCPIKKHAFVAVGLGQNAMCKDGTKADKRALAPPEGDGKISANGLRGGLQMGITWPFGQSVDDTKCVPCKHFAGPVLTAAAFKVAAEKAGGPKQLPGPKADHGTDEWKSPLTGTNPSVVTKWEDAVAIPDYWTKYDEILKKEGALRAHDYVPKDNKRSADTNTIIQNDIHAKMKEALNEKMKAAAAKKAAGSAKKEDGTTVA